MNFVTALVAFALVLLGGYYVFYVLTPSDRDAMMRQYSPEVEQYVPTESEAQDYLKKGVDQVQQLLPKSE